MLANHLLCTYWPQCIYSKKIIINLVVVDDVVVVVVVIAIAIVGVSTIRTSSTIFM